MIKLNIHLEFMIKKQVHSTNNDVVKHIALLSRIHD